MKRVGYFIRKLKKPPFEIGDFVRFEPDGRAFLSTQELEELHPGHVGQVTRLEQGTGSMMFEWKVYVDDMDIGFAATHFKLVD